MTDTVPDLNGIMTKLQELEAKCRQYENELQQKDAKLQAITVNKSKEMRALVDGMVKWLETLPVKDEDTRKQFEHGLYRMADRGESNPIFDVLCTASEQSVTRASELEKLRIEHEDLKKRTNGGQFASEDARLAGTKRGSELISSGPPDLWSEFEQTMMQANGVRT